MDVYIIIYKNILNINKHIMKRDKIAYVAMSADLIHVGHLNIINIAAKYGRVVVGLLTDRVIASYKRVPIMEYKDRYKIIQSKRLIF